MSLSCAPVLNRYIVRMPTSSITVNGRAHESRCPPATPLLAVLREELQLAGPKFGCGSGECGACMVLVDGQATPSCDLASSIPTASRTRSKAEHCRA